MLARWRKPRERRSRNSTRPEGAGFGCWANVGPSGANRFCMCDGLGASDPRKTVTQFNTPRRGRPALVVGPMSAPPGRIVFVCVMVSGLPPRERRSRNSTRPGGAGFGYWAKSAPPRRIVFVCDGLGASDPS